MAEVLDETEVYVMRTDERTELLNVFGELCVVNGGSGSLGNRDPNRKQKVAEGVQALAEELPFADLEQHNGVLEQVELFINVFDVALYLGGEYRNVADVYEARLESFTAKDEVQASLKCGWDVLQPERHLKPSKGAEVSHERRFVLVFFRDRHLPLAPICVQSGVHGGIIKAIDAVVHVRIG